MIAKRTSGLLDIERRILRLVMAGRRGKEIAPLVGTSYDMVEKHIKNAKEKLGGVSRMEAARLLALDEGVEWVQKMDPEILDLPEALNNPADRPGDLSGASDGAAARRFPWPFPSAGRAENDLTSVQRWAWILVLAVAVALLAAGLMSATGSLIELLSRYI